MANSRSWTKIVESQLYTDIPGEINAMQEELRDDLQWVQRYRDCVNYLSAAQIYLQDNVLLQEELKPEHM